MAESAFDSGSEPSWVSEAGGAHDETLLHTWLFRLRRERFRSRKSGKLHDYYVAHLADGVQAITVTPAMELVMVRQFRAGSRHDSLEMPGGLVEPGEDPCVAGMRELFEETGYAGDPPETLGVIWSNPAILSMSTTTIITRNARRVANPSPEKSEELLLELVPVADIPALIKSGRIEHAACIAGLLWWLLLDDPVRPSQTV